MQIKELLEKRLSLVYANITSSKKYLMKIIGDITVKVKIVDTDECFIVIVKSGTYAFKECRDDKPDIIIEGKKFALEKLIQTVDPQHFKNFEKRGDVKVHSKGLKGRIVTSKVKKLLGL